MLSLSGTPGLTLKRACTVHVGMQADFIIINKAFQVIMKRKTNLIPWKVDSPLPYCS